MKRNSTSLLFISAILGWITAPMPTVYGDTLVPMHSEWKYLDDGSDQGTTWSGRMFDDSGWASGPAQLGYGNGDEATVVSYGGNSAAKYITTYFRHSFVVTNAQAYTNLTMRLLRDDGAVVYLNGMEVARIGLMMYPVDYLTLATECAMEGKLFVGQVLGAGLLVEGTNVVAVEIHQASPASSDISFDLELSDEPPVVTGIIDLAGTNAVFAAPANLSLTSKAATLNGVTKMELLVNGSKQSEQSMYNTLYATFPCTFDSPTNCELAVAATDNRGIVTTSSVQVAVEAGPGSVPSETLVATGSDWRYLDDGSNPGADWRSAEFDDGEWPVGPAVLGHGQTGIVTETQGGVMTTYFRRAFDVPTGARFSRLRLRVLRDDGVKVFLNGAEVFRNNLPSDPVTSTTSALEAMDSSEFFSSPYFDGSLLVPEKNVLAVEMHQATTLGTKLLFDLELIGLPAPHLTLQRTGPDQALLSWPYPSTGFQLMETPSLTPPQWTVVTNAPPSQAGERNEVPVPLNGSEKYYRLRKP